LRNQVTILSASKADGCTLLQHQQHCQQQLLELQRGLAAAQAAASEAAIAAAVAKTALEPVDALRLQLAETQGTVAALQATAAGESCGLCHGLKLEVLGVQQLVSSKQGRVAGSVVTEALGAWVAEHLLLWHGTVAAHLSCCLQLPPDN
jgi:hypothetical protein